MIVERPDPLLLPGVTLKVQICNFFREDGKKVPGRTTGHVYCASYEGSPRVVVSPSVESGVDHMVFFVQDLSFIPKKGTVKMVLSGRKAASKNDPHRAELTLPNGRVIRQAVGEF